jgi:flagellar biosynthesis anti-sigma factor FlgM
MKIGDRKNLDPLGATVGGTVDGAGDRAASGSPDAGSDSVRVSQAARQLARLIARHEAPVDDVRSAKVEPLRAAVAEGRYTVDLQATARKLLHEVVGDLLSS